MQTAVMSIQIDIVRKREIKSEKTVESKERFIFLDENNKNMKKKCLITWNI